MSGTPLLEHGGVVVGLAMLASAWVARRTVKRPVVEALAHV